MAIESIASVKGHFETGDRPTQAEFTNLIDTLGRATPLAIASAAEGGKTGVYEILGDGDVTARSAGTLGIQLISVAGTTSARDALGITSVASLFLDAASTASSQTLLGGGTVGIATFEAASTASAQGALGVREWTLDTVQATTSGSTWDFTLPSWARQIVVMFEGMSLSGTDDILVQIGPTAGVETSGYVSTSNLLNQSSGTFGTNSTTGFVIRVALAANIVSGTMELFLMNSSNNTWIASHAVKASTTNVSVGGGNKSIAGTLVNLRVTVTGTDTGDAGNVNIMYKG